MVRATFSARKMINKVLGILPKEEGQRFGRDLRKRFDEIVTGDLIRPYEITVPDIIDLVRGGNYTVPKSLV